MCRSGVGRVSVMCRLCVSGESVRCRLGVERELDVRKECVGQVSVVNLQHFEVSVVYFTSLTRWAVGRVKRMWRMRWLGVGLVLVVSVMCRSGVGLVSVGCESGASHQKKLMTDNVGRVGRLFGKSTDILEVSSLLYKQDRVYYVTTWSWYKCLAQLGRYKAKQI